HPNMGHTLQMGLFLPSGSTLRGVGAGELGAGTGLVKPDLVVLNTLTLSHSTSMGRRFVGEGGANWSQDTRAWPSGAEPWESWFQ
ncbi:hypothetical protein HN51_038619, partial [Arachis hypogaea]